MRSREKISNLEFIGYRNMREDLAAQMQGALNLDAENAVRPDDAQALAMGLNEEGID